MIGFPVKKQEVDDVGEERKESSSSVREFTFLPEITMTQQWKMLDNSINCKVAAVVTELGIKSESRIVHSKVILVVLKALTCYCSSIPLRTLDLVYVCLISMKRLLDIVCCCISSHEKFIDRC